MPISDVPGYPEGHFSRVFEYVIKPAVEAAGYVAVRADEDARSNFIVVDIVRRIVESPMCLCDLSSRNPNVFYELGIRQAFAKPVALIRDDRTQRVFDLAGFRDVTYSADLRIDQVEQGVREIQRAIKDTAADAATSSPSINSIVQLLSISPASVAPSAQLDAGTSIVLSRLDSLDSRVASIDEAFRRSAPSSSVVIRGKGLLDAPLTPVAFFSPSSILSQSYNVTTDRPNEEMPAPSSPIIRSNATGTSPAVGAVPNPAAAEPSGS